MVGGDWMEDLFIYDYISSKSLLNIYVMGVLKPIGSYIWWNLSHLIWTSILLFYNQKCID